MKSLRHVALALLTAIAVDGRGATTQAPAAVQDPRLRALPEELRARGRLALAETDEGKRADLMELIIEAGTLSALDFILAVLDEDASPVVRAEIIDELEDLPDPRVTAALERRVATDPDPDIAMAALELLRARAMSPLTALLEGRLREARAAGDEARLRRFAAAQERWSTMVRGALLPTFMQQAPPVFAAAPPGGTVRVLAFGDFGDGSDAQRQVAAAMRAYHAARPFNFGVTLGDNFYPIGMASPDDERWKTWWSDLYDPMQIPLYATLGNHDWGQSDSPAAEVMYTSRSKSWRMPATRYTFTAGDAQFFALDTDDISDAQLLWLTAALDASKARWKIVYGHHPIYSHGQHEDNNLKIDQLLPALRDRADVYLAGHDHDMQHLRPEGRLHFFIAGSGGKLRPIEAGPRSLFAMSANGFAVLEIDASALRVSFVGLKGEDLYRYELK